jgi:choline dehydrogenase-like flavoprotein
VFTEADQVPGGSAIQVDLCIVGAGAAGITIAREFSGGALRVAVLESGGLGFEPETQELYGGENVGLPYFPLDTPRLRFFGGTTNHWAGVCRPFEPVDYERRAWIPYSGWPFGAEEVDPFYARAEDVVRLTSDRWDTDAWVDAIEPDPLPLSQDRIVIRVDQLVPPDLRSFASLYGEELRAAGNVTVYLEANVTEVRTDEGGSATEVAVATLSGNRFTVSARAFVVAVGGIDNARLLLASRGRHPAGLGNEHDLVGRFFAEHPRFVAGIVAPADPNVSVAFYRERIVDGTLVQPRLAISRAVQEQEGLADVQFRIDPVYDEALERAVDSRDVESLKALRRALTGDGGGELAQDLSNVVSDLMTWNRFTIPGAPLPVPYPEVIGELIRSTPRERQSLLPGLLGDVAGYLYTRVRGGDLPVDNLLVTARFEQVPNPDSRVTLSDEPDDLGVPRAVLDWRLTDADRHNVRRAMEVLGAEIGRAGVGRLRIMFEEEGSDWPQDLVGGYHLMGTTRMHADPTQGVVDADCRVHGTSNVFVAGSSVFPTGGSGNPTMLIVALALRLADHLKAVIA